ncbi:response regulator transcription factor [Sphingosinithalassobacter portus]|uniref:response regulator transcription factor n=1 Tax=Stakelama portus TaxID=2676234 RepID=UPI000D6E0CB7|nr:response regulator [Sphingosinithalassobacter portus]
MQAQAPAKKPHPDTVVIVDDDPLVRGSMESLFRSVGLAARSHASAIEALEAPLPDAASCLVVDIRMPHLGGFELQQRLGERGARVPIVFVTGHGDIPMSVRAMKAGAVDFLPKPFRDQDMLDAVQSALAGDRERRARGDAVRQVREQHARLTPREREVMAGVVRGLLNKQIAYELGLSEITVKLHRSSLMKKLGLRTVPDLVRTAQIVAEY